ncbi:MAG: DNA polymerase/3'-5' exonuclease PolX [Candidatus Portnoybacteria bacterium]|nr:DNA polymerase/3'-5' exonuclease PolX [Candidatus Portnoybacteria bacterium]MDD4982667.1 DNA polymerase/3'-5' exonuclease PolX [Candidatus Portnoybacteria bacterium]
MINQSISKIFYQISEYYAMDDVAFKPQAYERAARVIEGVEDDLADIYEKGGVKSLMAIEGVGQGLAEKIEEFIKTGKIKEYEKLKKACPVDLEHLTLVQGLGPKSVKVLYEKLRVKTLQDLEKVARAGKIAKLPRFGKKTQDNILRGLEYVKGGQGRVLLGDILPLARKFEARLAGIKGVSAAVAAGSIRRRKETVGDIDVLAITDDSAKAMDYFCNIPEVEKILAKGENKSSVRLHNGLNADFLVVPEESFGAALQYFTGNKDHNIELRKIAESKKYKLNEYGLFHGKKSVAGKTEKEIYEKLGLEYIEPEMRENTGEIEAAREGNLPNLVKYEDVKGDLQMHSTWSDGSFSILEMAEAAKKLGREYIAITDHAGYLAIAGGMKEKKLLKYMAEIEKADKKISGIKILKGAEVDINKDGGLEIKDEVLAKLDIVLASIHDNFKMDKEAMTKRVCRAMANPHMDIWAHPSGRVLGRREGYEVDWNIVFKQAVKTGTAIEINAYPERLDLTWQNVKRAIAMGVKLSIGTDAHDAGHLGYLELGASVARRGWCEKKDIINCLSWEDLLNFLNK